MLPKTDRPPAREGVKSLSMRWMGVFAVMILSAAFFSFLFSSPEMKRQDLKPSLKKVTYLPLDAKSSFDLDKLALCLHYGNPTLISKPSGKMGFSSICHPNGIRIPLADIPFADERKTDKFMVPEYECLAGSDKAMEKAVFFSVFGGAAKKNLGVDKKELGVELFPLWKLGCIGLPQLFADPAALRMRIAELNPLKPTVLKVVSMGAGLFPRVSVESSCELAELDKMAVETFIAGNGLDKFPSGLDGAGVVEVFWRGR